MGVWKQYGSGNGTVKVRVWNATTSAAVANKVDSLPIQVTTTTLLFDTTNNEAAPNVFVLDQLTAGNVIFFDIVETTGTDGATGTGYVQFAWGY